MNRIYRLVWSQLSHSWIAVAENAKGHGKSIAGRKLVAAALSLAGIAAAAPVLAGPTGGRVTAGNGTIAQSGNSTTINQSSQNLSLNWQSFNIAPQETVNFIQPSASSIAVNRIFDTNGTQILGHLNANGQVVLINPNGVLFGAGAQVNVGGLVASTLDVSDASLNSNTRTFSGTGTGSVINQGTINSTGGYVALLGNHVSNQGTISAQLGTVALGAGNAVTLTFNGDSLVSLKVNQSVVNSLAENGGLIQADGGRVIMTAGAAQTLLAAVVNNTGIVEARTVQVLGNEQSGSIVLLGGMAAGAVNVAGTLDASASGGGNGGQIETSAAKVQVANGAKVTTLAANGLTGSWLIDPTNFTISTGSAASSVSGIGATTLDNNLLTGSVNIVTSGAANGSDLGDINVNAPVSWSANTLTLSARNNIYINSTMSATGTAGLSLLYGQQSAGGGASNYYVNAPLNLASSSSFTTQLGSAGSPVSYTVITTLGAATDQTTPGHSTLAGMGYGIAIGSGVNFVLGSNIDASATAGWNAGQGFGPLGNNGAPFNNKFDGLGHTITGLTISSNSQYQGLFGYINSTALVQNVQLAGESIGPGGTFTSSYVGGLVGYNNGGTINNSVVAGSITGVNYVGGLVGYNSGGIISNSHVTGSVTGANYVGGLVGLNTGTISSDYAGGNTSGSSYIGGLAGGSNGPISNAFATGTVTGGGGLFFGGLVGINNSTISNTYATGVVNASGNSGTLVGLNSGTISNSFWDTSTASVGMTGTGGGTSTGVTGMTTTELQNKANFVAATTANGNVNPGWDFTTPVWGFTGAGTTPTLCAQSSCVPTSAIIDLTINGQSAVNKIYNGTLTAALTGGTLSGVQSGDTVTLNQAGNFASKGVGTNIAVTASDSITVTGDASGDTYVLVGQPTGLIANITPAPLTVTGQSAASKIYNGNAVALLSGGVLSGVISGDDVSLLTGSATFASKNVGNGIAVTTSDTLSGSADGNYTLVQPTLAANITAAPLTVIGQSAASKIYDGTTAAFLSGGALVGVISGDVVTLITGGGSFASKNVGNGIGVTSTDTLGGSGDGNYTLVQPTLSANITPATLQYNASPATAVVGTMPANLSGSVTGYVANETQATATTGTIQWSAAVGSQPGTEAITGSGLAANNYVFSQAPGNADALTLVSGVSVLPPLYNFAVAATQSPVGSWPFGADQARSLGLPLVAPDAVDSASPATLALAKTITINLGPGSSLQIMQGGVRLPDNLVSVGE